MPLHLSATLRHRIAASDRPLFGGWICSGSPVLAEIMAGSGLDWLMIDMEHGPNSLESVQVLLQVTAAYPVTTVVRVPANDAVWIKRVLDVGAQTIMVPMVSTAEQAAEAVAHASYPPRGHRGVGNALARSGRWNRVADYLANAAEYTSVIVQIETAEGVENAEAIAGTPGVDGVLIGPSDLAASMGLIGQQTHPDVVSAVERAFAGVRAAGRPVGVNAFAESAAKGYAAAGAEFLLVGADVSLVARGAESLARTFLPAADPTPHPSS
ncbi:HpcH/HpaI aldolase/citrate lyase family protein [Microbacterium caowuchunii]|uniref:HpcH/HpaI aldolase family protein n=1 Tax=Microbacterium caowuchunii TaxID=2614638 RepID=UPI00124774EA|nr:HpcH/HpaI aldolase/citrate lyase family protein [Microbacterium caowuchunii]QEW00713.1 HpcH/HpaI aldolase/citrate lyase family protein [Microbacterium caowuchunii]